MALEHAIDLAFSKNMDYIYEDADFKDTSWDKWEWLRQVIRSRVGTAQGDWNLHPSLSAGLAELGIGQPNTQRLGKELETRVESVLTIDNLMDKHSLEVRAVPVSQEDIVIVVKVTIPYGDGRDFTLTEVFTDSINQTNPSIYSMN